MLLHKILYVVWHSICDGLVTVSSRVSRKLLRGTLFSIWKYEKRHDTKFKLEFAERCTTRWWLQRPSSRHEWGIDSFEL